ncbi:MAG: hypothetical protein IJ206_03980 [Oscillospiraceae bacterium]|nr:hypothetical protein [Oscillospiraceae bacterium]
MTRHNSTRLLALLIAVILCMSHALAANIVREEDYEVVLDYSQMDVDAAVTTYLSREMKLNDAAVCGILANIEYESDFSPTTWGDGGTSYGLCQWHESRCRSLFSFCQENGYAPDSVIGQMRYLEQEVNEDYPELLTYLQTVENSAAGAYNAAWYWCWYYEIPAQREEQAILRGEQALLEYLTTVNVRNTGH